ESSIQPSRLVFLVQKEVGKRATALLERGEKESLLSLSIKAFGRPSYIKTVGKGHFSPPPKVDSAIVLVDDIGRRHFQDVDMGFFFEMLHLGFGQKRKQLAGNLSKRFDREKVVLAIRSIGARDDARAEDVDLARWLSLTRLLTKC